MINKKRFVLRSSGGKDSSQMRECGRFETTHLVTMFDESGNHTRSPDAAKSLVPLW